MAMILVFSIPILAILSRFATQWIKVRAESKALGASNRALEQKVERLERANAEYLQRLENVETIVVSQTWNALHEPGLSDLDRERRIVAARPHEVQTPALEELNQQRAATLARRLGG
jgi:hypothetical protein